MSQLEQRSRINNIEIVGVPTTKEENADEVVLCLAKTIGMELSANDISICHRVRSYDVKKPPHIICAFKDRRLKNEMLLAVKNYSKDNLGLFAKDIAPTLPNTKIFVNEHLTQENKKIYSEAKAAKIKCNWKFLWVKDGVILARQSTESNIIRIESLHDVAKIK